MVHHNSLNNSNSSTKGYYIPETVEDILRYFRCDELNVELGDIIWQKEEVNE